MGILYYTTGIPSPIAPTGHNLRAFSAFYSPLERFASSRFQASSRGADLKSVQSIDMIRDGLFLLNTRYLLVSLPGEEMHCVTWKRHTPIVVSSRIEEYQAGRIEELRVREERELSPEESDFYPVGWLIVGTGVNRRDGTCERIFLRDFQGRRDLGSAPEVEVLEHRVWNQRVEMRVRVSEACFARLAYGYFPHLEVRVDGQVVEPWTTAGWFIGLELEAGEHRIVLEPHLSPLRKGLLGLDLILLAVGVWGMVRERRRR